METETALTIQQAAERLGVSAHTLRYYERLGLLGWQVRRSASGHRLYSEQALLWIQLLLCLRQTGMSLEAIKDFGQMSRQGTATIPERLAMLERHADTLRRHITELNRAQAQLQAKIRRYKILRDHPDRADELTRAMTDQLPTV
jgi:DNA-binding transcriptional MerR regulator